MERSKTYFRMSFLVLILMLGSCTKVEKTTRKFIKEGRWCFTELTTNGDVINNLAKWDLYDCGDDVDFCSGLWTHANGSTAEFNWKFSTYSGDLEFFLTPGQKFDSNKATLQCSNLSGTYSVISESSNLYEFESYETNGFAGTHVYIKMEAE